MPKVLPTKQRIASSESQTNQRTTTLFNRYSGNNLTGYHAPRASTLRSQNSSLFALENGHQNTNSFYENNPGAATAQAQDRYYANNPGAATVRHVEQDAPSTQIPRNLNSLFDAETQKYFEEVPGLLAGTLTDYNQQLIAEGRRFNAAEFRTLVQINVQQSKNRQLEQYYAQHPGAPQSPGQLDLDSLFDADIQKYLENAPGLLHGVFTDYTLQIMDEGGTFNTTEFKGLVEETILNQINQNADQKLGLAEHKIQGGGSWWANFKLDDIPQSMQDEVLSHLAESAQENGRGIRFNINPTDGEIKVTVKKWTWLP